jgi:hypothetical protein
MNFMFVLTDFAKLKYTKSVKGWLTKKSRGPDQIKDSKRSITNKLKHATSLLPDAAGASIAANHSSIST